MALEFEQKFVLDVRNHPEIKAELLQRMTPDITGDVTQIRQYYDKDGNRFRATVIAGSGTNFMKEVKKSIKIGTTYSIVVEEPSKVSRDDFEQGWEKNRNRRLQKIRYTVPGVLPGHTLMVDFFYSMDPMGEIYAVIAEDETILDPNTSTLHLQFKLPIYLERYCLCTVNDSDSTMKVFKSANMVDVPENIEVVKKAIDQLYGPV